MALRLGRYFPLLLLAGLALLALGATGRAETPAIDFERQVRPLLAENCFACHGPDDQQRKASLRLDVKQAALGHGSVIVPGRAEASELLERVTAENAKRRMPPARTGRRLTADQVGVLRRWINQGAAWPEHWAFVPPRRPAMPVVKDAAWIRSPIDRFILARMEKDGLRPAPEADRATLLRRLSLDLTGLPPAPEKAEAFSADPRPDAYERLVERLLASPAYGERWGRHWLDVARYADSEGYEFNFLRPDAWRYRDYVVGSFNADKPFDSFVREQLAGDELLPVTDEHLIATGFLAAARFSSNEEDKAMQRNDLLVDITNATGSAYLGLTFGCAQCHSHKFDPITREDYYRLQGFFVQGQVNHLVLQDPALRRAYEAVRHTGDTAVYESAGRLREALYAAARGRLREQARKKLAPELRAALDTPAARRSPEQQRLAHQAREALQFTSSEAEAALSEEDRRLLLTLKKKREELEKSVPRPPLTLGYYSPVSSPSALEIVPVEAIEPLPYDPEDLHETRPRLLIRGDPHRPGPDLDVGWPVVFGPTPQESARRPRTALADWLTSSENPLTARVWANRIWHYHFGRGIVATPGDFGLKGEPPTHPELLDWLACELRTSGWSTKHLDRLIVTSATYRQGARPDPAGARIDPENKLCTHWQPRRLEAEAIRDALLVVSGEMNREIGGPGVPLTGRSKEKDELPFESVAVLRRSLYLEQRRDEFGPVHTTFDGPTANESCARRHVSTVALQPLFLLNSDFVLGRARAFAARVAAQAGADPERQIATAFRLALGRGPEERERRLVRPLLNPDAGGTQPALVRFCHALLNLNEFVYLD
jgi:hypothetical protein